MLKAFLFLLQIIVANFAFGSILTSNGSGGGNWSDDNTWSTGYALCVDTIIILANDIIDIDGHIDLEGCIKPIYFEINGTLNFPVNGDKLRFPAGSKIVGPTINSIIDAPGHDASNKISIVDYGWVFESNGNEPDLRGPFSFGNQALPITLLSFEASKLDNEVLLTWITASELNNDYFTVLRSENSIDWDELETVNGSGSSNNLQTYSITDFNPYTGITYYQLSQTDFDGKQSFSEIIVAELVVGSKNEIVLFPNPVTTNIHVQSKVLSENIEIYTISGKKIISQKTSDNKNTIDVSFLNSGVYLLKVGTSSQRFIKK